MQLSSFLIRRSVPLTLGAVVAVLAVAVAFGALGPDSKPRSEPARSRPLSVADRIPLPPEVVRNGSTIATDGEWEGDNTPVWFIRGQQDRGVARRLDLSDTRPQWESFPVDLSDDSPQRVLDIGEWPTGTVVFDFQLEREGVRARVVSLGRAGRLESQGFAALPRPQGKRSVAVATWSGTLPDLFVIDQGGARERLKVDVFSGESGFATRIASEKAPLKGLDPDVWDVDVSRVIGRRPSLVAFTRLGTGSGRPEVHVLTGDSGFQQFVLQSAVDRPRYGALPRLASGLTLARPSILLVEGRRLLAIPFAPPI